ncbi:hypothetical protein ACFSZS_19995 [Seohaeicola zhoushanensis]
MGQLVEQFGLVGQIRLGRRLQFGCIRRELRQFLGGMASGPRTCAPAGMEYPTISQNAATIGLSLG